MRKLVLLILVLGMTSAGFADVIVGNWETTGTNTSDGWQRLTSYTPGTVSYHVQPTGVTLGSWDMKWTETTLNHGNNYAFKVECFGTGANLPLFTADNWAANSKLEFDITRLSADWTGTNSTRSSKIYIQMAASTNSYTYTYIPVSLNQGDYNATTQTDNSMHLVADYSAFKAGLSSLPTGTGFKFALRTEMSGWTTGGVYYLDNVRLTPEPATVCLLGLGALSLFRKRRA
jgi:hypothetical protein